MRDVIDAGCVWLCLFRGNVSVGLSLFGYYLEGDFYAHFLVQVSHGLVGANSLDLFEVDGLAVYFEALLSEFFRDVGSVYRAIDGTVGADFGSNDDGLYATEFLSKCESVVFDFLELVGTLLEFFSQ